MLDSVHRQQTYAGRPRMYAKNIIELSNKWKKVAVN